jgi:biotin carboxylase
MTTPWLVLVESNTSGTGRLFAREALRQGTRPILLTDDAARYQYAEEDRLDVLTLNTADEEALFAACRELKSGAGLAGITSSSEYYIPIAASLAQRLGLPGAPPEVIRTCRDKEFQRVSLRNAGVGIPDFRAVDTVSQAVAAAKELGFPVVLKPVSGTGSSGVKLCADAPEVAAHSSALLQQARNERGMAIRRRILIEELATGPEYSVEMFGASVIGITQKHLSQIPYFVEVGHDYPAPLSAPAERIITQAATRAAQALGLCWGPAHLELRRTASGPKIIEVNPRLAGGHIPELVRLATGLDLIAETVRITRGQQPELKGRFCRHASIRFIISPSEGLLAEWEGQERARAIPGVEEVQTYVKPGALVSLRGDFRDRIGHVIATGKTAEAARATVEYAGSLVQAMVGSAVLASMR